MPRLSDTMEEGTVAKWFKKVGDQINEGDILAEIETDKATMEFESFNEGKLLYIGIEEGGNAPVDTLLAIIGEKGEDISDLISVSKLETPIEKTKNEVTKEVEEINEVKTISEGVEIITMPRLSDTMEEGTVAKWNKSVGDKVNEGDILAEIETDKATMEFESFYQGTLLHIGLNEGQSASVDSLLAIIGKEGTDVDKVLSSLSSISNSSDVKEDIKPSEDKSIPQKRDDVPLVKSDMTASASQFLSKNERIIASPLAKKLAMEKGIDLRIIEGSGDLGRIIKRDIDNFQQISGVISKPPAPKGLESITEITNSQMRKTIAKRLSESKFSAPHYYLGVEFDMDLSLIHI